MLLVEAVCGLAGVEPEDAMILQVFRRIVHQGGLGITGAALRLRPGR